MHSGKPMWESTIVKFPISRQRRVLLRKGIRYARPIFAGRLRSLEIRAMLKPVLANSDCPREI